MFSRVWERLKFELERFILGGAFNRLLLMALLIGAMSLIGGALVFQYSTEGADQLGFAESIWWAFLRLSDPGYLGDDTGTFVRVVSTTLTVLGYVFFLGALVAIMTQWLNAGILRLQSGLTPLALNNHILILGWSSRTLAIIRELLFAQSRVRRFLQRRGAAGRLRIVVLAAEVEPGMVQDLRDRLGPLWNPRQIILRSGTPLNVDHLRRVDFTHAAAVLLPTPDTAFGEIQYADALTVKAILSTGKSSKVEGEQMPLMVAELEDAAKLEIARRAYGGPIEVVASDLIVARLIAQNARHPGLSALYAEVLRHDIGNELYLREFPELEGRKFRELDNCFPTAIPLGLVVRQNGRSVSLLNPAQDTVVPPGSGIVLLAPSYDEAEPGDEYSAQPEKPTRPAQPAAARKARHRVLVLGWNHVVPALIREFDSYQTESFEIDVLSLVPAETRQAELSRFGAKSRHATVRMREGELTSLADITALEPATYDSVVILSTDRLETEGERDARTLLGNLVLREALADADSKPHVILELLDVENVPLARDAGAEAIVSPLVLSHILTQVALHREMEAVLDDLFGPGGAEILFRSVQDYGITGSTLHFEELQSSAGACAEIALGVRLRTPSGEERLVLNPSREETWPVSSVESVVALANLN